MKKIIIVTLMFSLIILAGCEVNKDQRKMALAPCVDSDNGDIFVKGECFDGGTYRDKCGLDGDLINEIKCMDGYCVSDITYCSEYGGYCSEGRCVI